MTLTDFLLARIAERQASDPQLDVGLERAVWHEVDEALAEKEAFSRQWLAECEAMRRIVALHGANEPYHVDPCDAHEGVTLETVPCDTLRTLAAVYADHPDYRAEWDSTDDSAPR